MTDLEQRIANLEAVHEIKNLKARYCEMGDAENTSELALPIFTEDAIWEVEGWASCEGRENIIKFFETKDTRMTFSNHMVMNPIIEVDGDKATGRWSFFGLFTLPDKRRLWMTTRYHDSYQKTEDGWKIKHVKAPAPMEIPYEEGW